MLDLNRAARQHLLVANGNRAHVTPRDTTWNMRKSLREARGLTVVAVLLLDCSPSYVADWKCTLENHHWLGEPVDVLAVRPSSLPGKVDAALVVNRQAGRWVEITRAGARGLARAEQTLQRGFRE